MLGVGSSYSRYDADNKVVATRRPNQGDRRQQASHTMANTEGDYETIFCSNGWVEIRNPECVEQWIATDSPTEVQR